MKNDLPCINIEEFIRIGVSRAIELTKDKTKIKSDDFYADLFNYIHEKTGISPINIGLLHHPFHWHLIHNYPANKGGVLDYIQSTDRNDPDSCISLSKGVDTTNGLAKRLAKEMILEYTPYYQSRIKNLPKLAKQSPYTGKATFKKE